MDDLFIAFLMQAFFFLFPSTSDFSIILYFYDIYDIYA